MSFHNKSVNKGKQIPRKTWQTIRQYTANHTVKSLLSLTSKIDNKKGLPLYTTILYWQLSSLSFTKQALER